MTLGQRIKHLRKAKGMTQQELADELGVTKGTVSTWETDTRNPGFDILKKMCDLFDRRMDYILGISDDDSPRMFVNAVYELTSPEVKENELTEYAMKYARLDHYGQSAVEAVIRAEYERCWITHTIKNESDFSVNISYSPKNN